MFYLDGMASPYVVVVIVNKRVECCFGDLSQFGWDSVTGCSMGHVALGAGFMVLYHCHTNFEGPPADRRRLNISS